MIIISIIGFSTAIISLVLRMTTEFNTLSTVLAVIAIIISILVILNLITRRTPEDDFIKAIDKEFGTDLESVFEENEDN